MSKNNYSGTWFIQEMEMWDADYFNMVIQAFIKIDKDHSGSFQFGLVTGYFNAKVYQYGNSYKRLEFLWQGSDENDAAFGFGWIKIKSIGKIEGEFRFHNGDDSKFIATKKGFKESLSVYDIKNQEKRIAAIINNEFLGVNPKTLQRYLDFLKENIPLPFKVTGRDSYFTYSDYKDKTPNGDEIFEIVEFEKDVHTNTNIFVKVKHLRNIFSLQLFEFKGLDKNSIQSKILDDYSIWIDENL